jgi:hypothetical protein
MLVEAEDKKEGNLRRLDGGEVGADYLSFRILIGKVAMRGKYVRESRRRQAYMAQIPMNVSSVKSHLNAKLTSSSTDIKYFLPKGEQQTT